MPLSVYLPKRAALRTKLMDSLAPSDKSRATVAEPQGKAKGKGQPTDKGSDKGNGTISPGCEHHSRGSTETPASAWGI